MQDSRMITAPECISDLGQAVFGELLSQCHRDLARARHRAGEIALRVDGLAEKGEREVVDLAAAQRDAAEGSPRIGCF